MTRIVLVDKTGTLKHLNAKDVTEEVLYKKCGLKKPDGFERRAAWPVGLAKGAGTSSAVGAVELWAKDNGRAGTENKYELPPPVDTPLYFGTMALVARDEDGQLCDLEIDGWQKLYDALFGGFEDLDGSESEEEDELDSIPKSKKTKDGYLKDGFVVGGDSDSEEEEEDSDGGDDDDDEEDEAEEDEFGESAEETGTVDASMAEAGAGCGGSELEPDEYYYSDDDA